MYVNLDLYQGFFPVVVVQVMPYSLMLHFLCKVYSILQILFFSYIKLSVSFVFLFCYPDCGSEDIQRDS